MKRLVDIIIDKLNKNELKEAEIFNFLAYYYSDLEKVKKNNDYVEKYKREIEYIFYQKKQNNSNLFSVAKKLALEVTSEIKNKNVPKIYGEFINAIFTYLLFTVVLIGIYYSFSGVDYTLLEFYIEKIVKIIGGSLLLIVIIIGGGYLSILNFVTKCVLQNRFNRFKNRTSYIPMYTSYVYDKSDIDHTSNTQQFIESSKNGNLDNIEIAELNLNIAASNHMNIGLLKKIVDIIINKLNKNELKESEIFNFLAYYYSDLEKVKKNNDYVEKYKREIEYIFYQKKQNNSNLFSVAKKLALEVTSEIKNKNLPKISGEYLCVLFDISIIFILFFGVIGTIAKKEFDFELIGIIFGGCFSLLAMGYLSILDFINKDVLQNRRFIKNRTSYIPPYKEENDKIYYTYLKNAQKFEAKNDYENAITEYNKALKMKPLEAKLYEYRSNCYVHIDKEKAKKDFEKAVSLNPSRYSIYTKVRFYQSINDNEKILNIYKNHLEENPQDYYILCERASVWIELGKIEEAKIDLRKAKKYVNDTEKEAQIQRTLDSLKSTKSKQKTTSSKSTTTSKKQVTVTVQNPDEKENNIKAEKYIENANSYEIRKDYINAINEYTKAIELNPDNIAEIYVYRAQCCMEFGQYNNVVEDCTKAIEKTKMYNSTAYYTRGLAYQKLNEKEKAKEDFKQALSIKPDDVTYKKAYDSLLKESSSKINIENCTRADILSLDGFNAEKAERFIKDRDNGKMWYDIDTFVQEFELQPHEMVMIQDRIKFPDKPKNKYGRKIDI